MAKVSILIPSRNEKFLVPTVQDLLAKAGGDVEIITVLEGYYEHGLPSDKRLKILHHGKAKGMREAINAAVQMSTGEYLAKADAHVMMAEGWDETLKSDYLEDNWILTPRRYALDPEQWSRDTSNSKYPIDYESLSWPWNHPDHVYTGFHGQPWTARREARKDILVDRDVSSQGSFWFMARKHWDRLGPMRSDLFGEFYSESQELGLPTVLVHGGQMMRTKNTWYAHWRKHKAGRGYVLGPSAHKRAAVLMLRWIVLNQWPGQVRMFEDFVLEFPQMPGWPADWESQLAARREEYRAEVAA